MKNTEKKGSGEALKDRALDAYKKHKPQMDTLAAERQKANTYFFGSKRGDEVKGRSEAISRDVFEIILWQITDLVRIFLSGQNVVEIRPEGHEDVDTAKLLEQKVNFDFLKLNKGFRTLFEFFFDALLYRVGTVKYYWKYEYDIVYRNFQNISQMDLEFLKQQKVRRLDATGIQDVDKFIIDKVETASNGYMDENTGMLVEPTFSVKGKERIFKSYPCVVSVPPEEISFNMDMKDRADKDGVIIHKIKIHKRKLREHGFKEEDINKQIEDYDQSSELQSRFEDIGGLTFLTDDKDSEFIYMHECYLYDHDEHGNALPKIVKIIGNVVGEVIDNEYGVPNFAFITPFLMSHRMVGISTYNSTSHVQDIQTVFLRNILDNCYYQNNAGTIFNQYRVDMSKLSEGMKPGMKLTMLLDDNPNNCMASIPVTPLAPQMIQVHTKIMPDVRAGLTGINKFNQGMDPKAVVNRTAGGVSQQMTASQGPRELIARIFAETGVRDLFQGFVDMNLNFFDVGTSVQINDKWQMINPEMLRGRGKYDVTIDVAIGTGSARDRFNSLMGMMDRYGAAGQALGPLFFQGIASLEHIRNIFSEGWELLGFKNTSKFLHPEGIGVQNGQGQGNGVGQIGGERGAMPGVGGEPNVQRPG